MADKPQSFENHARFVPLFHGGVLGILTLNALWSLVRVVRFPSVDSAMALLLGIALLGLCFYTRVFPLRVQDRLIRLEMRLRLREILPGDLGRRIGELNHNQLVALRFASDAELPDLVREVLEKGIRSRREIKKKIRDWQPDYLRC
jgi:hypothetical protein